MSRYPGSSSNSSRDGEAVPLSVANSLLLLSPGTQASRGGSHLRLRLQQLGFTGRTGGLQAEGLVEDSSPLITTPAATAVVVNAHTVAAAAGAAVPAQRVQWRGQRLRHTAACGTTSSSIALSTCASVMIGQPRLSGQCLLLLQQQLEAVRRDMVAGLRQGATAAAAVVGSKRYRATMDRCCRESWLRWFHVTHSEFCQAACGGIVH